MPCAQEVGTKQLGGVEIACVEMGEVPKDRVRAPFLAVGDWNGTVKILGLSPENLLEQVGLFIHVSSGCRDRIEPTARESRRSPQP